MRIGPSPTRGQTPPPGSRFTWLGGTHALDLCNTAGCRGELLVTPADLGDWLREAGLTRRRLSVSGAELEATRRLRAALRAGLVDGQRARMVTSIETWVNGQLLSLRVDCQSLEPCLEPALATVDCVMIPAIVDALELMREAGDRVRECAAPECPIVYLDISRNRSRRWCSMVTCGSRAKARDYYRRNRGTDRI